MASLADLGEIIESRGAETVKGVNLSQYLQIVSTRVQSVPGAWIMAEIAQLKDTRHIYIELVEHSENGDELAKCRAVIWASRKSSVIGKFQNGTGGQLRAGMKLMVHATSTFHTQYGFSLVIDDIDPTYTLGDMQRKLAEIRERLGREGVLAKNRQLVRPTEFTHVAVIAPDEAAGLGDFKATASYLERYGLCRFEYFTALFQGNAVSSSLCTAIHNVQSRHHEQPFDALVIIRGGGAVTDLAQLNEYQIAKSICIIDMPVFTGIGHEKDSTILDEVANQRFDTPSKVIAHIMETIVHNAREAEANWKQVWNSWLQQKRNADHLVETMMEQIRAGAKIKLQHLGASIETEKQTLVQESRRILATVPRDIDALVATIENRARESLQRASAGIESNMDKIRISANTILSGIRKDVDQLMEYITGMGPRQTLKRGYAIVRSEGNIIKSAEAAEKSQTVDIEFHDGHSTFRKGENHDD